MGDGSNYVPHREYFGSDSFMAKFRDVWFDNQGKSNYIWVCGAKQYASQGDGKLGYAHSGYNYSYTFVGEIEYHYRATPGVIPTVNADTTAHEIGHQFGLTECDGDHPAGVWCHEGSGTDYCLMSFDCNITDSYSEFCYNGPNHLMDIRGAGDGL